MHRVTIFLLALAAAASAVGSVSARDFDLPAVGPAPAAPAPAAAAGQLLVYSAYSPHAAAPAAPDYIRLHTDYAIFTLDGRPLQTVHNCAGAWGQEPVPVALPPGTYRLAARANGYGMLRLTVVIGARQTTVLHLEGGNGWSDAPALASSSAVRLPDGRMIGWRAASAASP